MIPGLFNTRTLTFFIVILIGSCSGNVIQTSVFTDGFQELSDGTLPHIDSINPAIYFDSRRGTIGDWTIASSFREKGFNDAWVIRSERGERYLMQTFTNLSSSNTPLSLITHPLVVAGDSLWQDLTMEVDFTPLDKFDKCGVVFKYRNPTDYFFFGIEGNTVILKQVQQSVTPLRPIEEILDYRPLVWTPGEKLHAAITVRRSKVTAILNDSIIMYKEDLPLQTGRIGLISDLPAKFHRVEVKLLKGEQRKLARRKRQQARRLDLHKSDHPKMVRWKMFETEGFGTNQNIRLGDLNGDGNKEIVFVKPNFLEYTVGSLSAMNLDGDLLWQFGESGSFDPGQGEELPVQIHDLDGDGSREVIFVSEGWIHVLEGKTGELVNRIKVPGKKRINSMIFADLLGIGRDNCMLLSDRKHTLLALNDHLELIWAQESQSGAQPMVFDMNGDGRQRSKYGIFSFRS